MTGLLDQVIANTSRGGARIVSENHDLSSINWVGGVTDPGEMVGCGMYQQLRRNTGESDNAYQARLIALLPTLPATDRAKIEAGMKVAATRLPGVPRAGDQEPHRPRIDRRVTLKSLRDFFPARWRGLPRVRPNPRPLRRFS